MKFTFKLGKIILSANKDGGQETTTTVVARDGVRLTTPEVEKSASPAVTVDFTMDESVVEFECSVEETVQMYKDCPSMLKDLLGAAIELKKLDKIKG